MPIIKRFIGSPNAITQILRTFSKFALNCYQANVFDPQHLQGASSDLVRSMFQVGQKAAELERVKLQTEIQKEKSEIRRKKLEKLIEDGWKSRLPRRTGEEPKEDMKKKQKEEDEDWLDDLVVDTEQWQMNYLNLEPGGFA